MELQIRAYVDELFAETVPSKKSVELKEEMIQNLTEKYNDLIAEGKTPEAAYNIAIAGIGDVSYLLKGPGKGCNGPEGDSRAAPADGHAHSHCRHALHSLASCRLSYSASCFPGGWLPGLILMFVLIAVGHGPFDLQRYDAGPSI